MCMVQVSLLLIYLLSYTLNPLLAVARVVLSILSSVTHYFLQFNSVLIIIDLVLVLVLGLEGQVLVNITVKMPTGEDRF